MNIMRWITFPDGSSYTFAVDIQKFAEANGYVVPCEADGTRHPGTDCNQKMRSIFKDAGMRRTFKITELSVVDIQAEDSLANAAFLQELVDAGIVSNFYLKRGVIQLYTRQAVNALLSVMLNSHVEYTLDETDIEWPWSLMVVKRRHGLEKSKNKPKVSLFKK